VSSAKELPDVRYQSSSRALGVGCQQSSEAISRARAHALPWSDNIREVITEENERFCDSSEISFPNICSSTHTQTNTTSYTQISALKKYFIAINNNYIQIVYPMINTNKTVHCTTAEHKRYDTIAKTSVQTLPQSIFHFLHTIP
jgi:hypothetical protein